MGKKIEIVEVGPRDGLQNEQAHLSLTDRRTLIQKLVETGLRRIEVGAFVSPKWVPQMAGSQKLIKRLLEDQAKGKFPNSVKFSALVPNLRGYEDCRETGLKNIAIFGGSTDSFSLKNINCTVKESFQRFNQVLKAAKSDRVNVRGYLSTAFGCPYEGPVKPSQVVKLIEKMLSLGVYEVSVGDTIGVATPKQVERVLKLIEKNLPMKSIAMHFHDTRGTALVNVKQSLDYGVRVFDSSVGGLGGCPYARGASGNLSTEDLVYLLEGMGYSSGVDLEKMLPMKSWIEKKINRALPSRTAEAGLPLKGTIPPF